MGKAGPETRLVAAMRTAAKEKYGDRLVVVKYHGSAYSQSGVSDLLCCLDGAFVAAEVKVGTSYGLTKLQEAFLETVRRSGGESACVRSVEEFLALLERAEIGVG